MGVYRLILSLMVVMDHFGGFRPLSGGVSVWGFFCLSGYLMALVIDQAYGAGPAGAARFWLNRGLRLAPILVVYLLLTAMLMAARDHRPFVFDPLSPTAFCDQMGADHPFGGFAVHLTAVHGIPTISIFVSAIPQAWSLVVECLFYLCAPLLAVLWRCRRLLFGALATASVALNVVAVARGGDFLDAVYINFFSALWVFMAGMALYYGRGRIDRLPCKRVAAAAALVGALCVMQLWPGQEGGPTIGFYTGVALLIVVTATLGHVRSWGRGLRRLERYAGDLAYGVFLNHFFAAMLLLEANEVLFRMRDLPSAFGTAGSLRFGLETSALAVLLSAATFALIERRVQAGRDRVRGMALARASLAPAVAGAAS